MADIKGQLIKDSYNYVLQSDITTGIVYRIGGSVPVNPIFLSGITVNGSFTYSDGSEQNGYVLTSDASGNASWKPISAATPSSGVTSITVGTGLSASSSTGAVTIVFTGSTSATGDYLPLSGGTVTGGTNFTSGLSANTISATTYYNLPVTADTFVTGFSLSNNIITLSQNRTGQYSAFTISLSAYTGSSVSGAYLPLSGGTLTGGLVANSGVTANTISQTSYIDFNTGSTNPSQSGGRVFFDNISKALSYYDIVNSLVPIAMGQQLYTRVWNATGAQIDKGKVIAITGTTNGLPSAILAVNTHEITSARPIGLAAENILNNSEGLVLNNGILSGITLNTFANGDTLYLSDTVPGGYISTTSSLAFTARTNEIGYVLQTGTTTGKIYVNINNEDSNLSLTDKERNILEGNVISSGVYEYTGMTQGTGATINVAYARGWIVRNTYGYSTLPDVTNVYYTGGTNIPLTYLNSADATYILINSGSTLYQQTTFPTPQQRRENILLGKVVHPNRSTITSINQTVDFDVSPMSAIRDLWTPLKLINQGVVVSANGVNMSINSSAGTLWGNGIGWTTNQQNPDSISMSGQSPVTFQYRTQLGVLTGGTVATGNTTTINPAYYDLNGVVTAVGGGSNSSTNQRIYMFPTGLIRIQLGQQVYGSLSAAVAGAQTEQFVEYGNNRDNGILIGILSINKDASVGNGGLVNTSYAVFNFVSKFGEVLGGTGGISTTTLQQAYDNSSTPEIVINATLDGLSIKNGTGNPDGTTNLLEGINAAGTTTSFIRADGAFSGISFFGSGSGLTGVFNHVKVNGTTQFSANTNTFINFSGVNVTITSGANNTLIFSAGTGGGGTGVSGDYLPLSGGTVTGGTQFTGGLSANTISATTYLNLPIDVRVTGGTYSGGQLLFTNNTGGTFSITGVTASGLSANYYGSFSNTNNLPVSGANIATVWTYNTTEISNGIVVQNNSQIKVNNKGIYEFGYSPQIEKTQGTDATVTIWATVNGVPVARSSSTLGLVANSVYQLPFVSLIFDLNANDYVEFYFSSNSQYIQLTSLSGLTTPTRPDSPALIVVAKQIGLSVPTTLTGNYLPLSGGTVTGGTQFTGGLTANTIVVGPTPSLYTTTSTTVSTGTNTIYGVSKTLYNSVFIDYSLSGSTGKRAGTIVGIWDGSNIEYNETSTIDIGNTSAVTFSLVLNTTADLIATISSSTWLIKTIIKSI